VTAFSSGSVYAAAQEAGVDTDDRCSVRVRASANSIRRVAVVFLVFLAILLSLYTLSGKLDGWDLVTHETAVAGAAARECSACNRPCPVASFSCSPGPFRLILSAQR